jgi:hypothetical protein
MVSKRQGKGEETGVEHRGCSLLCNPLKKIRLDAGCRSKQELMWMRAFKNIRGEKEDKAIGQYQGMEAKS